MKHLLEILKIIDGAVNADRAKVSAYTELLAAKLEGEGNRRAAERLRRALSKSKIQQISTARATHGHRLPVDSESRLSLADEEIFGPDQKIDIFLEQNVQSTVDEFLTFVTAADLLFDKGVGISPALIAHGPPGCGKTELGRYVASKLRLPLLTARTDSLISSFLGSTAKNIRVLFEHAMARPCVLFLDEFDAVAKHRDDQHELGELKRVVVSLLQNIDALDNQTIFLAATNHEHLLDPAIWRRFAYHVRIEIPTEPIRGKLFRKFIGEYSYDKQITILSAVSKGLSGSDIRQISEDAIRHAIIAGNSSVNLPELLRRVVQLRAPQFLAKGDDLSNSLQSLRRLDEKIFTYRRLAKMFDISVGHVSNLLSREI